MKTLNASKETVSTTYLSSSALQSGIKKDLDWYINNGYPFAMVVFDTIRTDYSHQVFATLDQGPSIYNGPIINHGDTTLKIKMISRWLRYKSGERFGLNRFSKIPILLKQMSFAESVEPTKIEWFGEKAIVHINLQKRHVNSFTGILGLLPQAENKGGVIVTGNVDGSLKNLFGQAVNLDLKWNRFAPSSQIANIKLSIPSIGFNGFGVESVFDLFRQDSLLSKQKFSLGLISNPGGLWQYKLGFVTSSATTSLGLIPGESQSISSNSISFSETYDPYIGSGIVLKKKVLITSLLPTIKKITINSSSKELPQIDFQMQGSYPLPIASQRFAVQMSAQLAGVWSEQILVPDQFRAGGLRSIRGFNENFFFTSQHAIITCQPQFLLDKTLLINCFSDFMIFNSQPKMKGILNPDWAFGLGFGVEIEVGRNLVQVSFANGISSGVPFDIQTSKIHFGYVARF